MKDLDFTAVDATPAALSERLNDLDTKRPAELEAHVYPGGVEVSHLVVNGPARRRGVARAMLEDAYEPAREAKRAGVDVDELVVTVQGGESAERFLRDLGFNTRRDNIEAGDDVLVGRRRVQ